MGKTKDLDGHSETTARFSLLLYPLFKSGTVAQSYC